MKKYFFITVLSIILLLFLFVSGISAANVELDIEREYVVSADGSQVFITETRTMKNNTVDRDITKNNNKQVYSITPLYDNEDSISELEKMVGTMRVSNASGNTLPFRFEYEDNVALIEVDHPESIPAGESYKFIFEYTNTQLSSKVGALFDIYVQAFSEDFRFSTDNLVSKYSITVKVPRDLGEENFVSPKPMNKTIEDAYDVYSFDPDSLVGQYVWIQRGKIQYYKFDISQRLKPTETSQTGNFNEYRMIIPMPLDSVKVKQDVYFTDIYPRPEYIERDEEGNIIGVFRVPSHIEEVIEIQGYAVVSIKESINISDAGDISDLPGQLEQRYFGESEFWEINAPEIQSKAQELKGQNTEIYTIISDSYQFIVDSIDYSQVKRFGLNERQGALKTLQGGAAVCMEYSDLYIALLRAQGIPTRAAFGYGYDSKDPANQQELHQWVQVYLPNQEEWLNIDPTWGENGPALIGGDMNHFLTHTASIEPDNPSTLSAKTYGDQVIFEPVEFSIETLSQRPEGLNMTTDDLLEKYQKPEKNFIQDRFGNYTEKLKAGVNSLGSEGINLQNSAQLTTFASAMIGLFMLIIIVSSVTKILKSKTSKSQQITSSP